MKKICYYPELVTVTESTNAALMMSQLEFWFKAREGKSFYKFLEPCEHERYKEGDSWQEELGMSSSEIRSAFKKIGIAYKSKKAFNEAEDIFQGKYYASYYDRIRKITYYFRNTSKVNKVFEALEGEHNKTSFIADEEVLVAEQEKSTSEVVEAKNNHLPNLKNETWESVDLQDGLCIQDNNQDYTYHKQLREEIEREGLLERKESIETREEKEEIEAINPKEENITLAETSIPYLEILKMYNQELGTYLGAKEVLSTSEKERMKYLWFKLGKRVEDFKLAFHKVAESSFLCGRLEGKHFRASLAWLLDGSHFKRIISGSYDDFQSTKGRESGGIGHNMQKIAQFNQMASHEDWDFEEIERLERAYIDQKLAHQALSKKVGGEK